MANYLKNGNTRMPDLSVIWKMMDGGSSAISLAFGDELEKMVWCVKPSIGLDRRFKFGA